MPKIHDIFPGGVLKERPGGGREGAVVRETLVKHKSLLIARGSGNS